MEDRQDPSQTLIEEVASILATGYLRLRNADTGADGPLPQTGDALYLPAAAVRACEPTNWNRPGMPPDWFQPWQTSCAVCKPSMR